MFIGEHKGDVTSASSPASESVERQDPAQLRLLHRNVQMASEITALKDALRGLGFRPERVVEAGSLAGGHFWLAKAMSGVLVTFDPAVMRRADPRVSPVAIAEAQSWFEELREVNQGATVAPPMRVPASDRRRA